MTSGEGVEFGIRSVAKLIGQMTETARRNIGYIATGATLGATKAFIAGQLGPQAFTPEEILTVPAFGLVGAGIGYKSASAFDTFRMETGATWYELKDSIDDNGKPLDQDVLKAVSHAVGGINAGMDQIGLGALMDGLKLTGAKSISKEVINKTVKSALKNPAFRKAVLNIAKKHAIGTATETLTEMAQEITPLLAKYALTDKEFDINEIGRATGEVGLETLVGTALLGIPSSMSNVSTQLDAVNDQNKAIAQREQQFQEIAYNLPDTDKSGILAKAEEAGISAEGLTLTNEDGIVDDSVKEDIVGVVNNYVQQQQEQQQALDIEVDKKLAKMDFEDQVKETQTLIKEIAEKARATKDPAAKRELVGQVVQLEEELGFMKEQDPDALAEEQEESDAIDQEASEEFTFDAEKKVATPKRINEEADSKTEEEHFQDLVDETKAKTEVVTEEDIIRLDEIEDKIGVPKGIITGREYDTTQANIIREIAKEEGISENEATMEYLKKDSKQFAKEHSIEQVETNESKAAAEGVGTTFDSNDNDLSGTANIAVAEHPELTKIVKGKLTPENATKEVGKYREKNADLLTKNPDMAVGTWYDEESDQTYIDVSTIIPKAQMDKAIQRGKDANQKAIFDLETFEEIDTGGTGEKVTDTAQKAEKEVTLDTGRRLDQEDINDLAEGIKEFKTEKENIENKRLTDRRDRKDSKKAQIKSTPRDIQSGEKPLVKAPKLAEAIQELKTKQEQEQTARREKVAKARKTSPKERAKGFKEVTGVADTSPIVTKTAKQTVKDTMDFLESQSKKIATGVRSEISEMQRDLAKITRETLPPSLRGNLIGKINSLVKIKNPELRVEKFNEAVQFVKDTLAKSEKKTAINSLKKTIVDISKKQKKVTSKKGREGFGTKETAETAKKVVTLRTESSNLGKQLAKTTDTKKQAELKRKISKKNKEAALLEAFNDLTNAAESPNEAIRSELSKLMSIPNTRIKKMETAQAEYAEGKLESIPEAIQKDIDAIANGQINIDQLSTQDANELNFKLQALAAGKKAVAAHIHNQNKQQAQARLTLALQELTKNNDVQVQSGPKKDVKGGAVAGLKGYVRRPSLMLQELFGGSDTTGYANTYGKVTQAANNAQVIAESFNQAKADIFSKINEKVVGDGLDFYDALTKPLVEINGKQHSTNEVMELYSLSQSPDGQRILDNTGYKTDSKVYADMLGKDYVEAVDKYLDFLSKEMYETLNVEYKRQHGVDMPTVDGKYFPLISLEVAYKGDALSLEDLGQQYVMPKLNDGMTHERVPHNYKLGSLDFFGKTSLYEKRAARYAGEAELLSQVDQLMNSTELQNTINAVNKHYGTASKLWIKQVIAGSQFEQTTHDALWDSVFTLKTNFVRSVLPLRLSVIAKQIPSFFGGTPQLTVKGFGDAEHAFLNASAINDYVDGKSVMMRNRAGESMQRLSENIKVSKSGEAVVNNEALRTAKKGVHILKNTSDAAFSRGIGAVDKYVTNALWYGKYKDEIRAGKNEAEAIASADTLINTTQPNFQNKDLSQMNRNRIVSLFKMFSSQLDQNLNRVIDVLVGKKMGLSAKERGTRAQGVVQSTVLISLTSLLFRWAQSYYSDDEENKVEPLDYIAENFAKQFSSDITHGVFGGLPVINTGLDILTQSSYNKLTDERATFYEYRTALQGVMKAPIGQVADDVLQAYNFSISDEPEKALSALRSAIEKAGGIPYSGAKSSFKQVGGLVKYLLDQLPDGDHRKEQLKELKF